MCMHSRWEEHTHRVKAESVEGSEISTAKLKEKIEPPQCSEDGRAGACAKKTGQDHPTGQACSRVSLCMQPQCALHIWVSFYIYLLAENPLFCGALGPFLGQFICTWVSLVVHLFIIDLSSELFRFFVFCFTSRYTQLNTRIQQNRHISAHTHTHNQ